MEIVKIILDFGVCCFAFYGCICLLNKNKIKKEEERKEVK